MNVHERTHASQLRRPHGLLMLLGRLGPLAALILLLAFGVSVVTVVVLLTALACPLVMLFAYISAGGTKAADPDERVGD